MATSEHRDKDKEGNILSEKEGKLEGLTHGI